MVLRSIEPEKTRNSLLGCSFLSKSKYDMGEGCIAEVSLNLFLESELAGRWSIIRNWRWKLVPTGTFLTEGDLFFCQKIDPNKFNDLQAQNQLCTFWSGQQWFLIGKLPVSGSLEKGSLSLLAVNQRQCLRRYHPTWAKWYRSRPLRWWRWRVS